MSTFGTIHREEEHLMHEPKPESSNASVYLAIIVPVYRNADTITALVKRTEAALQHRDQTFLIVFVVDASPDNSWYVIQQLEAENSHVRGILLPNNIGQHAAALSGLTHVNANFYAMMDADLQDPPELLVDMLEQSEAIDGTVYAQRIGAYQKLSRMVTSRLFKGFIRLWIGLPATYGAYLVMPHRVVQAMGKLNVKVPQIPIMAWVCSVRTGAVPYKRPLRTTGQSSYSGKARLKAARRALLCAWQLRGIRSSKRRNKEN